VSRMKTIYEIGDQVVYGGDLPCGLYPGEHLGIVGGVRPDASGDQIVTVTFSCVGGVSTQDIPASELQWAGDDAPPGFMRFTATSIDSPTLREEEGTGNIQVQVVLSDSGSNKLLLTLPAGLSFDLSSALAPSSSHRILVGLYPEDGPKTP
jgi:hypothetical protein